MRLPVRPDTPIPMLDSQTRYGRLRYGARARRAWEEFGWVCGGDDELEAVGWRCGGGFMGWSVGLSGCLRGR